MNVTLKKDRFEDGSEEFYVVIDSIEYKDLNKASMILTGTISQYGGIFKNSLLGYTEEFVYNNDSICFTFEPIDYKNNSIFEIEKKVKDRILQVRCWVESFNCTTNLLEIG